MMLIATSVAVALFASTASIAFAAGATAPASSPSAIPPMIVNVTSTPDLSPALVARTLARPTDWRAPA
jgi:hypothetical protein